MAGAPTTLGGTEPFRFLDLPFDIRITIYEQIPFSTRHLTCVVPVEDTSRPRNNKSSITVITKSLQTSILATCRIINQEAAKTFKLKLGQLRDESFRLVLGSGSLRKLQTFTLGLGLLNNSTGEGDLNEEDQMRKSFSWIAAACGKMGATPENNEELRSFVYDIQVSIRRRRPSTSTMVILRDADWEWLDMVEKLWCCLPRLKVLPGKTRFVLRNPESSPHNQVHLTGQDATPYPPIIQPQPGPKDGEEWRALCRQLAVGIPRETEIDFDYIGDEEWSMVWKENCRDTRRKAFRRIDADWGGYQTIFGPFDV